MTEEQDKAQVVVDCPLKEHAQAQVPSNGSNRHRRISDLGGWTPPDASAGYQKSSKGSVTIKWSTMTKASGGLMAAALMTLLMSGQLGITWGSPAVVPEALPVVLDSSAGLTEFEDAQAFFLAAEAGEQAIARSLYLEMQGWTRLGARGLNSPPPEPTAPPVSTPVIPVPAALPAGLAELIEQAHGQAQASRERFSRLVLDEAGGDLLDQQVETLAEAVGIIRGQ